MFKRLLLSAAIFLTLPLDLSAQERYTISYAGTAGFQLSTWATKDLGSLEKYGLTGDVVLVPGSTRSIQALLGGSLHFASVDATTPIAANLKGADVVIICGSMNRLPFSLVALPEIREPSQLKGKKIGIVNFGGANEFAVLAALNEWRIPPQSVTLVPSGGAANRLLALTAKGIDATVLSPPETLKAEQLGLRVMIHLSDLKAGFPMNIIAVRRSFLEGNREVVKRFIKAHADAIYQFKTDRKKGIYVYQKRLQQKESAVIEGTYDYYAPSFAFPPRVSREGFEQTARFVSDRAGGGAKIDVGKMLDEGVVDELEREGFFKQLAK